MAITNSQRTVLLRLRVNYLRLLKSKMNVSSKDRIIFAIQSIESFNRNALWRSAEYIYFIINTIVNSYSRKIDNISVGVFQIKIKSIFDYKNIPNKLEIRDLYYLDYSPIKVIKLILQDRNNKLVLEEMLVKSNVIENTQINLKALEIFLLDYSREKKFIGEFNYFSILLSLLDDSIPEWVENYEA